MAYVRDSWNRQDALAAHLVLVKRLRRRMNRRPTRPRVGTLKLD